MTPGQIIKGTKALARCAANHAGWSKDRAPEAERQSRLAECRICEHATARNEAGKLTALSQCRPCQCFIACKTALASQECGLVMLGLPPKWKAVTTSAEGEPTRR